MSQNTCRATHNDCLGLVRKVRMMAPFLSGVNVGHMELNERHPG